MVVFFGVACIDLWVGQQQSHIWFSCLIVLGLDGRGDEKGEETEKQCKGTATVGFDYLHALEVLAANKSADCPPGRNATQTA